MREGRCKIACWLAVLAAAAGILASAPAADAATPGHAPVLAMYYAWYDQNTWGSGKLSDQPVSPYISADRSTIERQVTQAQSAGIDGFELNWWGPGNPTDTNLQTLLSVANAHGFAVTADFDMNSPFVHNPGDVTNDVKYLERYFSDPAWLHIGGKPVVVFYGNRRYDVATWGAIRAAADPGHAAIWIAEGDIFSYLTVFDGIHPYSVAWSPDPSSQLASYAQKTRSYPGKLWMATVMPGYDDTRLGRPNGFAVNRQGGAYYTRLWQGAIATHPDLVSITSWNEWMEGTQIEPSTSYGDLYLRLTRQMSDQYHTVPVAATAPAPQQTATGAFYPQAGGGKGGYWITDDGGIGMYSSFRALGGVDALGYPSSQRFQQGGFVYQATQGAVLQWRPELGRAVLANTFEWFTDAGKDDQLLATYGIPRPIRDDGSGGNWEKAKQIRLGWLTDDAIRAKFLAAGSVDRAIELYGLPMSRPERHGPFIVQRFQRIAFQHWIEAVPGMPPPGSVVRVLAGDILKQTGLIPASAAEPTSG
ncbi:MAG TPA: endo-1,3-alpha-glucanase family glycosylhydrolase [Isosphaeraceae bacterium]|nr:endo-1,3-alpha-glucanase family glycosylhydrolase [Isosphaeraceae bacterium]